MVKDETEKKYAEAHPKSATAALRDYRECMMRRAADTKSYIAAPASALTNDFPATGIAPYPNGMFCLDPGIRGTGCALVDFETGLLIDGVNHDFARERMETASSISMNVLAPRLFEFLEGSHRRFAGMNITEVQETSGSPKVPTMEWIVCTWFLGKGRRVVRMQKKIAMTLLHRHFRLPTDLRALVARSTAELERAGIKPGASQNWAFMLPQREEAVAYTTPRGGQNYTGYPHKGAAPPEECLVITDYVDEYIRKAQEKCACGLPKALNVEKARAQKTKVKPRTKAQLSHAAVMSAEKQRILLEAMALFEQYATPHEKSILRDVRTAAQRRIDAVSFKKDGVLHTMKAKTANECVADVIEAWVFGLAFIYLQGNTDILSRRVSGGMTPEKYEGTHLDVIGAYTKARRKAEHLYFNMA